MRSTERRTTGDGPIAWLTIGMLRVYQYTLSPVFYAVGVRCRHEPTCSHYGIHAIRAQGAWRGGWLTLGRLLRCRPGGTFGYDPVPVARTPAPWWAVWKFRSLPRVTHTDETLPPAGRADDKDTDR